MRKKLDQQQKYYFSDKLKRQLIQISHYPLTVVEAPSGFGKTTAVREYLKENLPHDACEHWYTCLGESASVAWMGICELFSNVNDKVADDLKNLKMPTMDTLYYVVTYLRDIHCQTETYLVIDNYQLVNRDIPRELISVFSMHGNPKLHLIFITQQLESEQQILIHNNNIHTIGAPAFFFDKDGTARLFHMEGIRLTDDELQKVFMGTEGWVSAIRLQMISFMETGSLTPSADIEQLVENAIWNHLEPEEKDFLLSVSVLDSFTIRQAAIMLNQDVLPIKIEELLKSNDFIRYLPDKHIYSIHSILQDYLRNRLYNHMSDAYQNQIFRRAGSSCVAIEEYCPAAEFFYKVKDFDAILSLPFSREYLDEQKEKYPSGFCATIINECPDEILCKHPFAMIVFGYMTLTNGYFDEYRKLCRLLCFVIQNETDSSQEQLRSIQGEYTLLAALGEFNDIAKMKENQKKAWELLRKPSDMIKTNTPWLFGATSALDMFWRESGDLENVLQQMEEGKFVYHKLARGHGADACYLIRAEAMLMRGEDNEAEILCYKVLYDARGHQQIGICICAELVLARIAILRGNVEDYFTAIRNIQGYAGENPSLYILRVVEHSLSIISLLLNVKDHVAPWLYDMERIKKVLNAPVVPFAQMLHLKLLLMDKRYNEFYGICQLVIDTSGNSAGSVRYMMSQVYYLILLAIAKRNSGKHLEAQEHLKRALEIALPDQIYLPFAQQECMGEFLPELSMHFYESAKTQGVYPDKNPVLPLAGGVGGRFFPSQKGANGFTVLTELCKRQRRGVSMIRRAILQDRSPLTPREREIAQLARDRLSAKEIADKLYISEMTVRATLRNVYSKLDIHSKAELALKDL